MESPLLFHHSSRVFYWGALTGARRGPTFDAGLLYAWRDVPRMGLTHRHSSPDERFEVDGANVARDFLRGHAMSQQDIYTVWTAIALHTTPGIPQALSRQRGVQRVGEVEPCFMRRQPHPATGRLLRL